MMETSLPNYDGTAVVQWGKPDANSKARLIVGGQIIAELDAGATSKITTRFRFSANDKIRFEEIGPFCPSILST